MRDFAGAKTAQLLLFLLCCSAGMFAASSAFLPSTFVMYTLTLAATAVIDNHPRAVVAYAAVGVLLGWPVAGTSTLIARLANRSVVSVAWIHLQRGQHISLMPDSCKVLVHAVRPEDTP